MLQRRRGRLLVRLLDGLLGELRVTARVHARDLRAHAVPYARAHAAGFYGRLGYVVEGEPFEEVGVPHHMMARDL